MLVSLLNKSKSLLGVGRTSENIEPSLEATCLDEQIGNVYIDDANLHTKNEELKDTIFDLIRTIRDPEKPATLEDLHVVYDDGVFIRPRTPDAVCVVRIEFNPTVPHCSLATLIGLCIRIKLVRHLMEKFKLDIFIKKGAHSTEEESKQSMAKHSELYKVWELLSLPLSPPTPSGNFHLAVASGPRWSSICTNFFASSP